MKGVESIKRSDIREAIKALSLVRDVTSIANVAKYVGVDRMTLVKYIAEHQELMELGQYKAKNGKVVTYIKNAYETIADKPYTDEWMQVKREEYKNSIKIDRISDYGCIVAYNLTLEAPEREYINTIDKINYIVKELGLEGPKWHYISGGYGDSYCANVQGYKVPIDYVDKIKSIFNLEFNISNYQVF